MSYILRSERWDPLWIFLLCALCFCWLIGEAPLAGTEGFRALTATQMLESGDWVLPRLYGQLYLRKPPLMYWTLAGAELLAGRANEWVWRLPSALGAAFLGAFLCATARRWWGRAAGLTAGVAFLSLGALWSQFRSADIDALNTVCAYIAVIALFELARGAAGRARWGWTLLGGLATGCTLLLKGPATLPLILAALLAPALLNGMPRKLLSPCVWVVPLIAALMFGAYTLAVIDALGVLDNPAASSGLREAGDKMMITSWKELAEALLLPPQILLFALPPALTLTVLLRRATLGAMKPPALFMLKSLAGSFVIAAAIGVATGMHNPRYAYIMLPLFALLAGLLAGEISAGRIGNREQHLVNKQIFALSLLLGLAALGMGLYVVIMLGGIAGILPALLGLAALWLAIAAWRAPRLAALYGAATLALVACALGFAPIKNAERNQRSGRRAGEELRAVVGADAEVTSGLMIWTHPEIFHYAGVRVDARNRWDFAAPFELGRSGWLLFHRREWPAWQERWPERFSRVKELQTHVKGSVLTYYQETDKGGESE